MNVAIPRLVLGLARSHATNRPLSNFWRLTAYPQSTDHRAFSNIYTDVSSLSKYFYAYEYHTHEYDTRKHKNVENLIGLAAYWHWDELRFRKPANSI